MAKKIAVQRDDGETPKKKRRRCCTCCLIFLIVMLVIFSAAFGVGWYFGDKFTKENFDMSLSETLGVLNDLYWADDDDVVTNKYSESDIDGFYTQVKRNVLLKDDAEIDFDSALLRAVEKYLGDGVSAQSEGGEGLEIVGDEGEDDSSITDIFADMIAEVLNRDNIDLNRLSGYDEFDPATDEYIFELNDKQFAAFVNAVLKAVLGNTEKIVTGNVTDMIKLKNVVSLKQIRFRARNETDENGEATVVASTADITLWVGLQDAAGQAASYFLKQEGFSWASGLVGWLGDVILPENLYITMTVPLYGDAQPQITINNMNDKERAQANKLINGIISMTGANVKIEDILDDLVEKIKPYLEIATQKMSFGGISNGTLSIDLLDTLVGVASKDLGGDPLTKADFIYLLQAMLSDPAAQLKAIQPYRFQNRYLDENGKSVYIEGGSTELTPIDYEKEFIQAIEDKYSVDFGDAATLADVLAMLGVSLEGGGGTSVNPDELCALIDGERFNNSLYRDLKELELHVTDRMLGAALSSQLNAQLTGGGSGFENLNVNLDAFTFIKNKAKPNNLYAYIVVEIDLADMLSSLGGDGIVKTLAANVLPERVLLTVTVDITRNRAAGEKPDKTQFMINACSNTDRALDTLGKLLPELDLQKIAENIESMLNGMLDQMYKNLNIVLVPSAVEYDEATGEYLGETASMVLPDIFTVITDTVLVYEDGERVVEPDELKDVLRALNDTEGLPQESLIADSYSAFIDDVVDKYYLKPADGETISTFDALIGFMDEFSVAKFRISGEDGEVKYLAHDTRGVDELKPFMTDKELGALIQEQIAKSGNVGDYTVMDVLTSHENKLTVVLKIAVDDLLPDKVRFLLAEDGLYVTAEVDMNVLAIKDIGETQSEGYKVSLKINNIESDGDEGSTFDNLLKIVRFFMPEFDIQSQVDEFGVILYERLNSLNSSISFDVGNVVGGDGESVGDIEGSDEDVQMYEFTDDGLSMIDFYTFLSNKMSLELDEDTTAETVKGALQGMYEYVDIDGLRNGNNYALGNILRNVGGSGWSDERYLGFATVGGTYSDVDFNGFLKTGVESIDSQGQVHVEQTVILHSGDVSDAAKNVRNWVNSRLGSETVTASGEFMLVTFRMTMQKYMETGNAHAAGFYPESVYATLVFEKTVGSGDKSVFNQIGLIFNDMTSAQYAVIVRLMDLSADTSNAEKVNILSVSGRSASVLNELADKGRIDFGGMYNNEGIGSLTFTSNETL